MYRAGAFRPVDRFISDRNNAEDKLADAIAMVFEMDTNYAAKGTVLDAPILVHACRLRATDATRRFVKTDAQPARDVLHPPNYTAGKVEVHRLDGLLDADTGGFEREADRTIELALHYRLTEDPTMRLNSAIDLADWLDGLDAEDVKLLVLRQAGHTLEEIATATGKSTSIVFKRIRDLGLDLAERAGIVIAKKARKPRGRSAAMESEPYDA